MDNNPRESELYEKFWDSIRDYLAEKFTDCPIAHIEEATATVCYKAMFLVNNVLANRDKMWMDHIAKENNRIEKQFNREVRRIFNKGEKQNEEIT